jgi:hypothetical protein
MNLREWGMEEIPPFPLRLFMIVSLASRCRRLRNCDNDCGVGKMDGITPGGNVVRCQYRKEFIVIYGTIESETDESTGQVVLKTLL